MKFILGKKLSMTQVWNDDKVIAVTPVLAGPCVITQVKTKTKDGYEAVQLAHGTRKAKNINKPQLGHVKNLDIKPAHLREFRVENPDAFNCKINHLRIRWIIIIEINFRNSIGRRFSNKAQSIRFSLSNRGSNF